ncbi:PTS sugar transporter subunit IIA [Treponema ruminis]|uniref:Mannitol/fructose-specific phosphotransferase system IIA component (Ntr-type) n=2 Tax=Treponema ruminis TaxID=744515 RepID=A0A7W8LME4_9SPIR|nr:PTS sugar transporter subunit IIA [Treponema ruminis]MBB5226429.1 mannitol/fructose-specific phosphotransferase system IIA component (Ntr-type) [Treponema ruminis]QSI02666.1 PTS sugar transporter subunit IIA [Treponema ruminis]
MVLGQVFPKNTIVMDFSSTEKDELFEELVETIHSNYPGFDKNEALNVLNERESKMTTGIMHSVGIPHALIPSIKDSIGAIGISHDGIDYDSLDKAPVHVVFMIIGPDNDPNHHIQILKQLASVLQIPDFVKNLLSLKSTSEIYNFICTSEESLIE